MLRRSSAVNNFDLFEDAADEVVGTNLGKVLDGVIGNNADKVSDDEQTARKTGQALATTDRPQKHALAMDDTRDPKRVAKRVGISRVRDEDAVTVVADDIKEMPVPLKSNSAEAAADSSHPAHIAAASSSNVDISPPASPSKTAPKKYKKKKAGLTSTATMIGSSRKQPVPIEVLTTASTSSRSSLLSPSTNTTATEIMAHNGMLPSHRTGLVIEPTDDEDEIQVVNYNPVPVTKKRVALPLMPAKHGPEISEAQEVSPSQNNPQNKPTTTQVVPKAKNHGPLSGLSVYVIPTDMDNTVFRMSRERVVQLDGEWLGPKTVTLSTDPRAVQEMPALNQKITTHIVTTLNSIESVKR
ncbi:hypothetical protein BG011_002388, partial [Mortierella polycephala]